MKTTERIAASYVQKIVVREITGWPPVCSGYIYQPERPVTKSAVAQNTVSETSDLEKNRNK